VFLFGVDDFGLAGFWEKNAKLVKEQGGECGEVNIAAEQGLG
jgi:hypothetical protein